MVVRSRATDERSASKCQGKWPDQALCDSFGLPALTVAVRATSQACQNAGKSQKWNGSHPGIPGLVNGRSTPTSSSAVPGLIWTFLAARACLYKCYFIPA
jgi:hypothetical protein